MELADSSILLRTIGLGKARITVTSRGGGGSLSRTISISRVSLSRRVTDPVPILPFSRPTESLSPTEARCTFNTCSWRRLRRLTRCLSLTKSSWKRSIRFIRLNYICCCSGVNVLTAYFVVKILFYIFLLTKQTFIRYISHFNFHPTLSGP